MPPLVVENPHSLRRFVGREIATTEWFLLTQDRIQQFAETTEDRQWIHVDRERAQRGKAVGQIAKAPAKEDAGLDSGMSAKLAAAARQSPAEPGGEQRFMQIIAEEQPLKPDLRCVKPGSIRDATASAIYPSRVALQGEVRG